ncbi:hypothetical protein IQ241_16405 [Romeria aff. gracilis LEGE 07310]|uniref:Uncharacterized protein n=1 Tax=Vasconcelosia minhoensis LEGE 07310 TaxID=915328 RepID=A0A8J7APD6_9CYAN|nr:hypothetical protein [Romeria gracilis]MBE9078855.1 hypothetical protein [Romeria aff. gracilis LEGE 07310]
MSYLILVAVLFLGLGLSNFFDALPDLILGWLQPPRWVWWGMLAAILAWLTGDG